jgi:hypothetical protein
MPNTTPTLQRTWQFSTNQIVTADSQQINSSDGRRYRRELLYQIKEAMTNFATLPWVVTQSYGQNAGLNLAGDAWADNDDIRWNNSRTSTATSWLVLSNAALGLELCLHCYNASTRDGVMMDAFVAPTASPFGSLAAGTTSTRPTSSIELQLLSGDDLGSFGCWGSGPQDSGQQSYVLNVMHSTDGLATRVIILLGNEPVGFWQFEEITNQIGAMTYPWVARMRIPDFGGTANQITIAHLQENGRTGGFRNDGVVPYLGGPYYLASPANDFFADAFAVETTIKNPYDARWALSPVAVASEGAGWDGFFGTLDDIWFVGGGFTGKGYPASSNALVQFGEMVFPWNGSIPQTN